MSSESTDYESEVNRRYCPSDIDFDIYEEQPTPNFDDSDDEVDETTMAMRARRTNELLELIKETYPGMHVDYNYVLSVVYGKIYCPSKEEERIYKRAKSMRLFGDFDYDLLRDRVRQLTSQ